MKTLHLYDLRPDDRLNLVFGWAAYDSNTALERELEPFLQTLETYSGGWMPDVAHGKRVRKYSRTAVLKGLEERRDEHGTSIGLYRTKPPVIDMTLRLFAERSQLTIWLSLQPLSFFATVDRSHDLVEMVRAWASRYPTTHATANSAENDALADAPIYGRDQETWLRDEFDKIYDLSWLNVFEPKLVESVGRRRVLSTPAHRVEELPNGGVLLVTWPIAAEINRDDARQAQARAFSHLRPDLDYDAVLRTLRDRSAKLAPVEPNFHPDLAPVLSRVADLATFGTRQTRIAELNDFRPPEPDEWLPADAAPLSDVPDREAAINHLGWVAEHLVALLHTKVPSVWKETVETLIDLDVHFWREDFPEFFQRKNVDESAVPAIGAYLGNVLVRQLGGEWIPRKKIEESQVRVGPRAWLPFIRAWRYMRSTQSLLDHSLTQLYREAERYGRRK